MKNITKLSYLLKTYNRATTILGHHVDLQSSQWRACSDILYDALSGGRHQSLKPSFKDAFTTAIFMFLSIWPSFISIHAMISLFSNFHIEKTLRVFMSQNSNRFPWKFQFYILYYDFKKKKQNFESDLPNFFNPWTISDCEVWWFDIFDSCSLIQPIRLLTFAPSKKCFWLAYFSMLNESKEHADDTCTLKKSKILTWKYKEVREEFDGFFILKQIKKPLLCSGPSRSK